MPLREAVAAPPPLIVGQIETAETADALDRIMAAGLDVAFVGVTDLTVDMAFDQASVDARIEEVRDAAIAAGVRVGMFASSATVVPPEFRYLALSSDLAMLRDAATRATSDAD